MNKEVRLILDILHNAGYEAYLVGGCVRDKLMGRDVHDYDICTSARPEEVETVFADYRVVETGLKHGTVTVMMQDDGYEITTFRTDGEYSDGRHPDSVSFVRNLREDLLRRDFTMNAIAFDGECYTDLFGGEADIRNKIVRCVGDANARFREDALRILRAMRFASQLGFSIDEQTKEAMHLNRELIRNVSSERIAAELQKMLLGQNVYFVLHEFRDILAVIIPEFEDCFDFDQKNIWHVYDVYEHIIHSVQNVEADKVLRLTMLFHDIGKPVVFKQDGDGVGHFYGHNKHSKEMCIKIMRRLKFDKDTIDKVSLLVEHHDRQIVPSRKSMRKLISKIGYDASVNLLKVKCADNLAQNKEKVAESGIFSVLFNARCILDDVLEANDCTGKKQLAINGNDLAELGLMPSPTYSVIFNDLLEKVMGDELVNEKEELLGYVRTHYIFKVEAVVDAGRYGKKKVNRVGKDLDTLEAAIREDIVSICADINMPIGNKISAEIIFYELDIELERSTSVYAYGGHNQVLIEINL